MKLVKDKWSLFLLSGLLLPLAVLALKLGSEPISLYQNVDPRVFVERSTELANTWDFSGRRDPIGRYVPIAALFLILEPSAQIASTYAAFMSYVAIPATLYLLFKHVSNRWTGIISVAGFIVWRLVDIGVVPYNKGSWQYDNAIPFVYLGFISAHSTVVLESKESRMKWSALTGVFLGIVGLTQYTLAVFAVAIVSATYLFNRRFTELFVTGGMGSLFALLILIFPGAAGNQGENLIERVVRDPTISAPEILGQALELVTTPGLVLFLLMGMYAVLLYRFVEMKVSESNIISIALVICGSAWLSIQLLNWGHIHWIAYIFGQYLLIGLCADLTLKALGELYPGVPRRLNQIAESYETALLVATSISAIVLTLTLLKTVPNYLS